jgi:protein gp37
MYKRFHWDETPKVWLGAFQDLKKLKTPSRIFVGSTFELFHEICEQYDVMNWTLNTVKQYQQHTFIFLTKQPQNLIKYSPFPDNCWVGVSATNFEQYGVAGIDFPNVEAKVKFISFEPLLERITDKDAQYNSRMMAFDLKFSSIKWLIIGQQTPLKLTTQPKIEWIKDIVDAAKSARVPVFLKDNLIPMIDELPNNCFTKTLSGDMNLRQEYPELL